MIPFYSRYVHDAFSISDNTLRQIELFKNYSNKIKSNIQFTLEKEVDNIISFLESTASQETDIQKFNIYRKPTTNDTTYHTWRFPSPLYVQKLAAYTV